MADRDLDITKFSYFAYRKLKKTLGEFDAVVECNEIAIQEFIEKITGQNSRIFIQELSAKHNIKVDEVDLLKFSSRIRQYYIASVSQQSEQFLKDFKNEWKEYFSEEEWKAPQKGQTNLENTFLNIGSTPPSDLIDIYEYYRLVRNYMSHTDRDITKIKALHDRIHSNSNSFLLKHFEIDTLPNEIKKIDFSDFLILTNIVKHVAFVISTSSKPSNEKIAEILMEKTKQDQGKETYAGLKKLKNNQVRYENAIKGYMRTIFGRFSIEDEMQISEHLKSLLA